jgi:hypothetical protein
VCVVEKERREREERRDGPMVMMHGVVPLRPSTRADVSFPSALFDASEGEGTAADADAAAEAADIVKKERKRERERERPK